MAKTVRIYSSGGCGINIGKQLIESMKSAESGLHAKLDIALIDTSTSNLGSGDYSKTFYHIQGDAEHPTDGSGMDRKTNYPATVKSVPHIIQKFPPGDFNIFIQSASGGKRVFA